MARFRLTFPSSPAATLGPQRGHIRATDDRIAGDNHGQHRPAIAQVTGRTPPPTAGRRDPRVLPDTEAVTGASPSASDLRTAACGGRARPGRAGTRACRRTPNAAARPPLAPGHHPRRPRASRTRIAPAARSTSSTLQRHRSAGPYLWCQGVQTFHSISIFDGSGSKFHGPPNALARLSSGLSSAGQERRPGRPG
jgi:hypothetical protein